jgi:hypothetical protein
VAYRWRTGGAATERDEARSVRFVINFSAGSSVAAVAGATALGGGVVAARVAGRGECPTAVAPRRP